MPHLALQKSAKRQNQELSEKAIIMAEYEQEQAEIARIRLPKKGEILGIAMQELGAGRIRVGDLVMIEPWIVQSDERADIVWRYTRTQSNWLKRKGYVKKLNF